MAEEAGPCSDDSQTAMFSIDVIVENILTKMPMKQLQSCARVCKMWHSIALRVKRYRQAVGWLLYSPQLHTHDIQEQVAKKLALLSCEPQQAIVFISSSLYEDHVAIPGNKDGSHQRRAKMTKMPFVSYLRNMLPSSCQILTTCSDGVVGSDWDSSCYEIETALSASCLLLPHIDGVKVRHFTASAGQLESYFDESPPLSDPSQLQAAAGHLERLTGIAVDDEPRLVLLFYVEHFSDAETDLATRILLQYGDAVVAGGYVDQVDPEMDVAVVGVALCGGSNIQVASAVIGSKINTSEEVKTVLQKLQHCHIKPGPRTFAFMFACIGRGQYHYHQQSNVEANVFHKLFPSVPLFGFFGNGELGFEYQPDYSRPLGEQDVSLVRQIVGEDGRVSWQLPELYHSYTTIFVLVSLA